MQAADSLFSAVLRALADGKIKWAFYPPDTDLQELPKRAAAMGVWMTDRTDGDVDDELLESDDEHSNADEGDSPPSCSEDEDSEPSEEEDPIKGSPQKHISSGTGMFGALSLQDESLDDEEEDGNE